MIQPRSKLQLLKVRAEYQGPGAMLGGGGGGGGGGVLRFVNTGYKCCLYFKSLLSAVDPH